MGHLMFIQTGVADATGAGFQVPSWLPWGLVAVGVVVLGVVVIMLLRGNRAASGGGMSGQAAGELADLKNQLVEVKKLAATVADDLDRRAARLERLIAQADEVLGGRDGSGRNAAESARGGGGSSERQRMEAPAFTPVDDLAQRVFALADQGRSAVQIAQALRQPVGNVELMLALRGGR